MVPFMGLLESIAIAKAFGMFFLYKHFRKRVMLQERFSAHYTGSSRQLKDETSCFSSASQNDYRIDANQELLAMGVTNISSHKHTLSV